METEKATGEIPNEDMLVWRSDDISRHNYRSDNKTIIIIDLVEYSDGLDKVLQLF